MENSKREKFELSRENEFDRNEEDSLPDVKCQFVEGTLSVKKESNEMEKEESLLVVPDCTHEILLDMAYLFKEISEKWKTISSIGGIAKTKEIVECINDETLYKKLRASYFASAKNQTLTKKISKSIKIEIGVTIKLVDVL